MADEKERKIEAAPETIKPAENDLSEQALAKVAGGTAPSVPSQAESEITYHTIALTGTDVPDVP